ncbi:flavin reductase [Halobellus sp. GM3]|uniref:flavin reductase n=1 Tax=Halobellus sp. GM3 TaxID=3458410 RepID=UPI00403DC768
MEIDPRNLDDSEELHHLTSSIVAPRPIAWVSTRYGSEDNLSPYSYFNAVSFDPIVIMFAAIDNREGLKDTPRLVLESGEFVLNIVDESTFETMDKTSTRTEKDEFDLFDIEREEAVTMNVPRVADAVAHLECSLESHVRIYNSTVIFGNVEHLSIEDEITTAGHIDPQKLDSVGRLGGPLYTALDRSDVEWTPERLH